MSATQIEVPGWREYERVYVLLPPDADAGAVSQVAEAIWDRYRFTIGGSADDAGIGALEAKHVIALNPQTWAGQGRGDLGAFFATHYPDAIYHPIAFDSDYQLAGRLRAAAARIRDGLRLGPPTTHRPLEITDQFGTDRGDYFHNGLDLRSSWAVWRDRALAGVGGTVIVAGRHAGEPWYGQQVRTETPLAGGDRLLVRYAHLCREALAVSVGDQVQPGQPLGRIDSTGQSTGDHLHVDVQLVHSGSKHPLDPALVIDPPPSVPLASAPDDQPPRPSPGLDGRAPSGCLISLHLQTMVGGVEEFCRRALPRLVKVFSFADAAQIKRWSPETLTVLRYYTAHQDLSGNLERSARDYVASFRDSLERHAGSVDFVESWNETVPTGDRAAIVRAVEFDCQFARALAETGLPVAPALLNVAVGNPQHGEETELLLPAVEAALRYDGVLGYHAYWWARAASLPSPDDDGLISWWPHHAGRALKSWDPTFTARGLCPRYVFGEAGAVGTSDDGHTLLATEGWRSAKCLRGDLARYLDQLAEFERRIDEWNLEHGGRCLGAVLFTTGIGCGWNSFQIRETQMAAIAARLRQETNR